MADELVKVLISMLGLGSITVNVLLIIISFTHHPWKDVTRRLIISSAFSDLGCGLFIPTLIAAVAWIQPEVVPRWLAVVIYCPMFGFGAATIAHQCLIAVVKCVVIVKPFSHEEILSDRRINTAIALLWIGCIANGCVPLITDFSTDFESGVLKFTSKGYSLILFVWYLAVYVMILCVIIASYGIIFVVIWKQKRKIAAANKPTDTNSSTALKFLESIRSAKNMFIVFAVFLGLFLPVIIGSYTSTDSKMNNIVMWVDNCHCFTTSFLIIVLHKKVRDVIKMKFCQWFQTTWKVGRFVSVPPDTPIDKF